MHMSEKPVYDHYMLCTWLVVGTHTHTLTPNSWQKQGKGQRKNNSQRGMPRSDKAVLERDLLHKKGV